MFFHSRPQCCPVTTVFVLGGERKVRRSASRLLSTGSGSSFPQIYSVKLCEPERVSLIILWQLCRDKAARLTLCLWLCLPRAQNRTTLEAFETTLIHMESEQVYKKTWTDNTSILCLLFRFFFLTFESIFFAESTLFRWYGVQFYSCLILQSSYLWLLSLPLPCLMLATARDTALYKASFGFYILWQMLCF